VKELSAFLAALIVGSFVSLTGCDEAATPAGCKPERPMSGTRCPYYFQALQILPDGSTICACPKAVAP
jgi:hypothetical protein